MTLVEIHTKATALRRSGEWIAALTAGDSHKGVVGADSLTTRHRMDLAAAIAGLSTLKRRCAVELHTDSEYLIGGAITWFPLRMSLGWLGDGQHRIRNHML
jgi:ribonuclease HI